MKYTNPINQLNSELLIEAYQNAYEANCSNDFILLLRKEIENRELSPHLYYKPTCLFNEFFDETKCS